MIRPIRGPQVSRWSIAVLVVVCFLLASCSGDDDAIPATTSSGSSATSTSSDRTTTTSGLTSTTTTTATPDALDAVITERYIAFWDARFQANTDPVDPDDPMLRELATGEQLVNVIAETQKRKDAGLAFRNPEDPVSERRVRLIEVNGEEATIQDCATNDGVLYRVATGEVVDDSVVTRSISATMRLVDGTWRLAAANELQKWEGVAGCALASES